MMLRKLFRIIRKKRFYYSPLIEIHIDRKRLLSNLELYQKTYLSCSLAPVLKSNAYGHGLLQVASILTTQNVPFCVIDSYFEALMLRNEGVRLPLLVIGFTPTETILQCKLPHVSFTLSNLQQIIEVCSLLRTPRTFHLKMDTGMHRQGIQYQDLKKALDQIRQSKACILEGFCTHLADADTNESDLTKKQLEVWNASVSSIRKEFPECIYFHVAATAGSRYASQIDANVIRLGIGLYGIDPTGEHSSRLLPALEMVTQINAFRTVQSGEMIGYNGTYKAEKELTLATIPVGYYEGLDRRLSNKGFCEVNGVMCPIVGRISMNMLTLDVSCVPHISENMQVIVVSNDRNKKNSLEQAARLCETIPYDFLVHIPQHLRRTIV